MVVQLHCVLFDVINNVHVHVHVHCTVGTDSNNSIMYRGYISQG